MQIVIDIPNRIYKIVQNKTLNIMDAEILEKAVKNGTPLPKGHGRLIDADVLRKKWVFDRADKEEIDEAPTILGATESEDNNADHD